jgi:hypothetical protein
MTNLTVSHAGIPAGARSRSRFARRLLVGASAGVLAALLPTMAFGQALPADCAPAVATAGDTIDCVVAAPATIDGISTTVDDLTINIGSLATPTSVENLTGTGISMWGTNGLTLNVIGAASGVTGSNFGVYMANTVGAGDITLTSEGAIRGGVWSGVSAANFADAGSVFLDLAAVDTAGETGIYGRAMADLSIIASGSVTADTAGSWGILATGVGTGSVTIRVADVSASGGDPLQYFGAGILVNMTTGTDIIISSTGTVSADGSGILAQSDGSGEILINAVNATGGTYGGIIAGNYYGTDTSIHATGIVSGAEVGIGVVTYGTGALMIDAATVTSSGGNGIFAYNSASGTDVTIIASGVVSGYYSGVYATNAGYGALSITTAGVTGTYGDGIYALNDIYGTDLTIRANGDVAGGEFGVYADNYGQGELSITTEAVAGTNQAGIAAYNSAAGTDLTITANGVVSGGEYGIYADNRGDGALTIATEAVTGTLADGIAAYNSAAGTDLTIIAGGSVTGGFDGIYARNFGTGGLSITAMAVSGTGFAGIDAGNSAAGTDLTIVARGDVTADNRAIRARNSGTGALTITTQAASGSQSGIDAKNYAAGTDLTITAHGAVSGTNGVTAANLGTGVLSVTTAAVAGSYGDGIHAWNSATGTGITVTVNGAASGGRNGVRAENSGTGALIISTEGVTGGTGSYGYGDYSAILATNSAQGTDLTLTANGAVDGIGDGIVARNYGTGVLSIVTAAVTGRFRDGILASNTAAGTDLYINSSAAVSGAVFGIAAVNSGRGALEIDVAGVAGASSAGIFARNAGAGGLSITASGAVSGGAEGIQAYAGAGDIMIDVAGVTGAGASGISTHAYGSAVSTSISASGIVSGGADFGIAAAHYGSGALSIDAVDVSGAWAGIHAVSGSGSTDLTITATGAVTGSNNGLFVTHRGQGSLGVEIASASGAAGDGLSAFAYTASTGVSVTASGTVTGAGVGVRVRNFGSGATVLDLASVAGANGYGIQVDGSTLGTDVSVAASGLVSGGTSGIRAENSGSGAITIETADVTGAGGEGILALGSSYGTDLSISSSGLVTGGGYSTIYARNQGSGLTVIDVVDVSAVAGTGIMVSSAGGLSLTSTGLISGAMYGVRVSADSGDLAIDVHDVTGTGRHGLVASGGAGVGEMSITARGLVSGQQGGLRGYNAGTGALSIDAVDVTSNGLGIRAYGTLTTTDMSINVTGVLNSAQAGLYARNSGSGALTISVAEVSSGGNAGVMALGLVGPGLSLTATGAVSGETGIWTALTGTGDMSVDVAAVTGRSYHGIHVTGQADTTDMSITASGAVSGVGHGIFALHSGSGTTVIDAASVSATNAIFGGSDNGTAIYAQHFGTGLTISASGLVTGANSGITAENRGTGAMSVTTASVTGDTAYGIEAINYDFSTDLSVSATSGSISGARTGVLVRHFGLGATVIDVASASGGSSIGIYAGGVTGTTDTSITASGSVSGGRNGVMALAAGSGALTIDLADATGTTETGIFAQSVYGSGVSITASGTVSGGTSGIHALNVGSGALSINVADVSGGSYAGILAVTGSGGTQLNLTASGAITGGEAGIIANHAGSGAMNIRATDVSSGVGTAIELTGRGTDVGLITTGLVSGYSRGISVRNRGTGSTNIAAASVVSTTQIAIYARNDGADLSITTTGAVSSGTGIFALQYGSGALNIEAADVTGTAGDGIVASLAYGATGLSVSASGTVTGSETGIAAASYGTGTLAITAANVSGAAGSGIQARAGRLSNGLEVNVTGTSTGGWNGIGLSNQGYGALTLNAVDAVGGTGLGINADGGSRSTDMTITAANVTNGVRMWALGSGQTSLNVGNVTTLHHSAINVYAGTNSTGLDVTATGSVQGADTGISVTSRSATGSVSITTAAAVTGDRAFGINAYNAGSGGLSITAAGDVTGGIVGILARSLYGALTLDIGGDITGGSYGLFTETVDGTNFDVRAGQTVSGSTFAIRTGSDNSAATSGDTLNIAGTLDGGIFTGNGADTVTLMAGGIVNGAILLEDDEDTLNYAGGSLGAARGGSGTDTVNFSAPGVRITNSGGYGDLFGEFEIYNFLTGGYVLDGLHRELIETNFLAGDNYLIGTLASQDVMIATGAGLEAGRRAAVEGNLTNGGHFGINRTGTGVFTIRGDFTQLATGALTIDANAFAGWRDRIVVSGDLVLGGELALRQYGNFGAPITLIDGGTALAGSFDTVTGLLASRLLVSQAIVYDAVNFDVNLVTVFGDAGTVAGLTPNQASVANGLTGQLTQVPDNADFTDFAYSVVSIGGADGLSAALEQLNPEILDAGVQAARNSQFLFLTGLMNGHGAPAPGPQPVQVASLDNAIPDGSAKGTAHVWGSLQMAGYDQSGGGANVDFTTDGVDIAFGTADLQAGAVRFGFAVGYAGLETDLAGPDGDHVSSEIFRYGLFGRYELNAGETGLQAHLDGSLALGRGSLETRMDVPAAGVSQAGETHFNTMAGALRLTLDGYNGTSWIVRPHLLVAADRYDQNAQTIGAGRVTAIASDSFQLDRVSYGYGASIAHQWGVGTALEISATSLRHGGDAASAFSSSFAAPGLDAVSFNTTGREIEQQYILQGRLTSQQADGYAISIQGFAQFGDLDGAGAEVRVSKRF